MKRAVLALVIAGGLCLGACGSTSSTSTTTTSAQATGFPAASPSIPMSTVACELGGMCVGAGADSAAVNSSIALEVSPGGSGKWRAITAPEIGGASLDTASCWRSSCLIGGSSLSGALAIRVNPTTGVASVTAGRPAGSTITALACPGPGRCLALIATSTSTAVFETTNGADSWRQLATLPTALSVGAGLACANAMRCVAVGTGRSGAATASTSNGGTTWRLGAHLNGIGTFTSVACLPDGACYATDRLTGGGSSIALSTDFGQVFAPGSSPIDVPAAVTCVNGGTCVYVGANSQSTGAAAVVSPSGTSVLSTAYVPDPMSAVGCALADRCAAVTAASTVSIAP